MAPIEQLLRTTGRRWYIGKIYAAVAETQGYDVAQKILASARVAYHSAAAKFVENAVAPFKK